MAHLARDGPQSALRHGDGQAVCVGVSRQVWRWWRELSAALIVRAHKQRRQRQRVLLVADEGEEHGHEVLYERCVDDVLPLLRSNADAAQHRLRADAGLVEVHLVPWRAEEELEEAGRGVEKAGGAKGGRCDLKVRSLWQRVARVVLRGRLEQRGQELVEDALGDLCRGRNGGAGQTGARVVR